MDKPFAGQIVMPNVISDIPDYSSPIDGRMITSRSERRDDLKRNICKKRGLQVSEEFR
jgi:hypothetical protein